MASPWQQVTRAHVEAACALYDEGAARPARAARTTFLLCGERRYPAKFIRGLAYELASGQRLAPAEYAGGEETARFFERLGLRCEQVEPVDEGGERQRRRSGANVVAPRPAAVPAPPSSAPRPAAPSSSPKAQKAALLALLRRRSPDVQTEVRFPWLTVPGGEGGPGALPAIRRALRDLRGFEGFARPGLRLACDFFLLGEQLIIEYDERQHFTAARACTLQLYPPEAPLGFDARVWLAECLRIDARDGDPPYRDEQRAYYDALRDLLAAGQGMRLIRVRHGEHDWAAAGAMRDLTQLLGLDAMQASTAARRAPTARASNSITRVALVSHDYRVKDSFGRTDFGEQFRRVNELCDQAGCDTILYALYTISPRSPQARDAGMFARLASVRRIVLEVAEHGLPAGEPWAPVEIWERGAPAPRVVRQCFATSSDGSAGKEAFIADLPTRSIADGVLVLCGETNVATARRSGDFADPHGFTQRLDELGAAVILNPIHDYMRRPEMARKRRFYSQGGRTVLSVWNRGKGKGEARLPWTVFHDGVNVTAVVEELESPLPQRPDVRIGIVDLSALGLEA
jgi:hypothetical protein